MIIDNSEMNKYRAITVNAALLAVLVIAVPLLFSRAPQIQQHRLEPFVWNMGHILLFFALTWLALNLGLLQRKAGFWTLLIGINLAILLLGFAIEAIQATQGREASLQDIYKNSLGATLAILLHPTIKPAKRKMLWVLRLALLLLLVGVSLPLAKNTLDWLYARASFPVLANFETPFEAVRWREGNPAVIRTDSGNHLLSNEFRPAQYSTLTFINFQPDWRDHACLQLRVKNTSAENVLLHLRINDRQHNLNNRPYSDRFNMRLDLQPGWNEVDIPIRQISEAPRGREMVLAEIEEITFFTVRIGRPVTLYLDDLKLGNHAADCVDKPATGPDQGTAVKPK